MLLPKLVAMRGRSGTDVRVTVTDDDSAVLLTPNDSKVDSVC